MLYLTENLTDENMYLDNFIIKISKSESDYHFIASNSSSQLIEARPNYCDGGGLRDIFRRFQQRLPDSNYSVDPSRPFILWLFIILLLCSMASAISPREFRPRAPALIGWRHLPPLSLSTNQRPDLGKIFLNSNSTISYSYKLFTN